MAQKFILLECNRLNANLNYKNIDESEDIFKNRWVNNVNSYGIVIEPGDVISCENSAINTTGASDTTIEFLGSENVNGFMDNKVSLVMDYYLNDTGQTNIKLPLREAVTMIQPFTTQANQYNTAQLGLKKNYKNRTNGTVCLNTFTNPQTDPASESIKRYLDPKNIPTQSLVYDYKLSPLKIDVGSQYQINRIYPVVPVAPSVGTGMFIKIIDVINEGTTASTTGIPSKIQLWVPGSGFVSGDEVKIGTTPTDGSSPSDGNQVVIFNNILAPECSSKVNIGPTGRRYYFPQTNTNNTFYTGPCDINYNGIINTPNNGYQTGLLNNIFEIRNQILNLEVPAGLNTPDNIGTILTDQLHEPELLRPFKSYKYFDYKKYDIVSKTLQDQDIIVKPVIYQTPSYQPHATNAGTLYNQPRYNTYDGARAVYYSNIGYDDPKRISGLSCLNGRQYELTNTATDNQFNSGENVQTASGDFFNQEVGDLGLYTALMMTMTPGADTISKCVSLKKKGLILTNLFFIESNIRDIANGFRTAEEYFGNYEDKYSSDYQNSSYTSQLGVPLDIGRYHDGLSNAYPLNIPNENFTGQNTDGLAGASVPVIPPFPETLPLWVAPQQRLRYGSFYEIKNFGANVSGLIEVDKGRENITITLPNGNSFGYDNYDVCVGSIPFAEQKHLDGNPNNDGQELSSFVVQSRYSSDLDFNPNNVTAPFQDLYDILTPGGPSDKFSVGVGPFGQFNFNVFNNSYIDTGDLTNTPIRTSDLMAMAKKYDLAVVPVWPDGSDAEYITQGGRPYIAFVSLLECGDMGNGGVRYDTTRNGLDQIWQIDYRNCPYGIQLGYDPSFIRNNAVQAINSNYANSNGLRDAFVPPAGLGEASSYNQMIFMGSVNPSIDFSSDLSRFTITGLNTPMTIGNGIPTNNQFDLEPSTDPEQQCYNINVGGQLANIKCDNRGNPTVVIGQGDGSTSINYTQFISNILNEFVPQYSNSIVDSFTGLAIRKIILFDNNNVGTFINNNGIIENSDYLKNTSPYFNYYTQDILQQTLLGKMGFTPNQLINQFGCHTTNFYNPLTFQTSTQSFLDVFYKTPRPQITGAFISSAEYQPSQTNSQDMPLYANGSNIGLPSRPAVVQGSLTAQKLPTKLDYPYLLIYSSIISGGTDTEYYGGHDGKSKLPCVGFITRNYNQGDFFYGLEQSFNYTATKSFTLTDIETEIRLPDGSRPRLDPHNSVIYKITKTQVLPPEISSKNNIYVNNRDANETRRRRERES